MSWWCVRGAPYRAQRHLDSLLEEVVRGAPATGPRAPRDVTLSQVLYHCLLKYPDDVFMINGTTGMKVTNGDILKQAVPLARALRAYGATERVIMLSMRNHERALVVLLAALFARALPFMMEPNATVFELTHFVDLVEPCLVFCDEAMRGDVTDAITQSHVTDTRVIVSDTGDELADYMKGQPEDIHGFDIPCVDPDSPAMLIPTSGSTGLPKAAIMSQRGLVIQLPMIWAHQMPCSSELVLVLTTLQWMTFAMHVTSCPVYRVPLLLSPGVNTTEHITHLVDTYKPTLTFMNPAIAKLLVVHATADQLASLRTFVLVGGPSTVELHADLRAVLSADARVVNGYGTTETQGYIAVSDLASPTLSCGPVLNIMDYKLLDEEGRVVGLDSAGELCLKGDCVTKGYYKNPSAFSECCEGGWYRTGDKFHIDGDGRLTFQQRIKFSFKFRGSQVSPEEVESVILSVEGVTECCVCGTGAGPAAAIVTSRGASVTREQVHQAVNGALSDHKRLHGGVAFVPSLPHTHSGKLRRGPIRDMLLELQEKGECC